jgi:hypothetical protein
LRKAQRLGISKRAEQPEPGDIAIQHDSKTSRAYHAVIIVKKLPYKTRKPCRGKAKSKK